MHSQVYRLFPKKNRAVGDIGHVEIQVWDTHGK